jgi:hypothetical protein
LSLEKEETMSEFVLLFRGGRPPATYEEGQQQGERWVVWMKELSTKGVLKLQGHRLERTGKIVKGPGTVTDGPFAEKDIVGGYFVIEARDLTEAAELSKGCPIFHSGGEVEVRPVAEPPKGP